MAKGRILLILFIALAALLLAGCRPAAPFECSDALGCVTVGPEEPVEIGIVQALSGEAGTLGRDQLLALELALGARGAQIAGHPLQLHTQDGACSAEGGAAAADALAALPQLVAVFGPTCSSSAVPAARILSEAGLSLISGGATAASLTSSGGQAGPDWQPGFFRTAHSDADLGQAAAVFAYDELGLRRAATIDEGDPYTQGLAGAFNESFSALGGEVVYNGTISRGMSDLGPILDLLAQSGAELLFFPLFEPQGHLVVQQVRGMDGLTDLALLTGDALLNTPFLEAVGEAGSGLHIATSAPPDTAAYEDFAADFQARYDRPPSTAQLAAAFDAVNLLLDAIEAAAVEEGDTLHIDRQALRDQLRGTDGFEGLAGELSCDDFGDCGRARFEILRLDDPAAGLETLQNNVVFSYGGEQ